MVKLDKLLEEIIDHEDSLGIAREDMPQIDSKHIDKFKKWSIEQGCDVEPCKKTAKELSPSQNELDSEKADGMYGDKDCLKIPIIISQDNYVLDGHHRWFAMDRNEPDGWLNCIKLGWNAKPALDLMHDFDHSFKKDIEDEVVEKLANQVINKHK